MKPGRFGIFSPSIIALSGLFGLGCSDSDQIMSRYDPAEHLVIGEISASSDTVSRAHPVVLLSVEVENRELFPDLSFEWECDPDSAWVRGSEPPQYILPGDRQILVGGFFAPSGDYPGEPDRVYWVCPQDPGTYPVRVTVRTGSMVAASERIFEVGEYDDPASTNWLVGLSWWDFEDTFFEYTVGDRDTISFWLFSTEQARRAYPSESIHWDWEFYGQSGSFDDDTHAPNLIFVMPYPGRFFMRVVARASAGSLSGRVLAERVFPVTVRDSE